MPTDQLDSLTFRFRETLCTLSMQKSEETYELINYRVKVAFRLPMSFSETGLRLYRIHACAKQRYKQVGPPKAFQDAP